MAYRIVSVEWWRTCCEPGVINESKSAGGARYAVQVYDLKGWSTGYTFDVIVRGQVYFGAAKGFPLRHWVIRDVYPSGEEPLHWPYKSEQRVEYIGSDE